MAKPIKRKSANVVVETDNFSSAIIQLVHDAIIVVDEDQNIVLFNQGAEQTFGYNASEVIGQRLDVLLPPQVSDFHAVYIRSFAKDPETARLMGERKEVMGRRKNGTIFPAEASIAKVSSAGKIFFTAILRDITERKIVEQALRESEEKHSMVLNGVDEIIYQVSYPQGGSGHGTVEFVSERTQELLGFRPTDFITDPNHWFSLIHPEDIPAVQSQTASIMKTGQPGLRSYRIKDINGDYRWLEDRVSPQKDKTGRVVRTFGVARDITERKQAEQQMKELSLAVEQTADCVVITDREGVIQYVNAAFEKETGYTREEALGKTPRILKSGEHDPRFYEALWKTILAGNVFKAVFINRRKTGELVYEQKTITPLMDSKGNITHFVSTAKNITEQAQAEEDLRESEKQYRDLFESTSDLIQAVTPDGRLLFANRAWRQALGYTEQELINLNIDRVVHPEALTQCFETLQRALSGEQVDRIETRFVTKEGKSIIVEGSVNCRFEASQPVAITCFLRDITKRKQADEALRQSEEKYRTLVEQASDGIIIADADGNHIEVNSRGCEMLGYTRAEILQLKISDLLKSGEMEGAPLRLDELRQGKTILTERELVRKDGSMIPTEVSVKMFPNGQLQAIVRDITERKRAEAERAQLLNVLEASLNEIYIFDAETLRFQYVNQGALSNLGYTREAISGMTPLDLKPEFDEVSFRNLLVPLLSREREQLIFQTVHRRADASLYPVEVHLQLVEQDGAQVFLAIILDITERRRAEEALRKKEEHHNAVIENIFKFVPEGVLVLTESLNLLKQNKAFEDILQKYAPLLGYTEQELSEKLLEQLRSKILGGENTEIRVPKKSK